MAKGIREFNVKLCTGGFSLSAFRLRVAEMEKTLDAATGRRPAVRLLPATTALTALGVVYGDIGTSGVVNRFSRTSRMVALVGKPRNIANPSLSE